MMPNELSTRIDRDRFHMVDRNQVSAAAFTMLNGVSAETRVELLAAGAALLFAAVAERVGMTAEELHRVGHRILFAHENFDHKGNSALESLRDFAALRLRNTPII